MSNLVDLTKKVEKVLLAKNVAPTVKVQVGFAVDISGSMSGLYSNGTMETVVERVQAIANRFDDNHVLDMWAFNRSGTELKPATAELFGSYVARYVSPLVGGGTSFAPVTKLIEKHYFSSGGGFFGKLLGGNKSELPVYLAFLTDGDNDDERETESLIQDLASKNIYVQFIGIGTGTSFRFVRRMADVYGHVGFLAIPNIERMSDDEMYSQMLNDEFIGWLKSR